MWTIRRSNQHIKTETLSEYLDDRLRGGSLARVDEHLALCEICQAELESVRGIVTMLQNIPMEAPSRSFVMAARPPESVPVRPSILLGIPQWVYAGAASVAAIVLIVLVSADATGLLAADKSGNVVEVQVSASVQTEAEEIEGGAQGQVGVEPASVAEARVPSEIAVEESPASVAMAAEAEWSIQTEAQVKEDGTESLVEVEPASVAEARVPSETAVEESPASVAMAAEAEWSIQTEAQVKEDGTESLVEVEPASVAEARVPREAAVEESPASGAMAAEPEPTRTPIAATTQDAEQGTAHSGRPPRESEIGSVGVEEGINLAASQDQEQIPTAEPASKELPQSRQEATATYWRVLEVLAGVLGLVFLAGLTFRWKISRRTNGV